jgi:hypothetical protein
MIIPVQITFRNVASTPEAEEKIRTEAQKLEKFYRRITSCRVLVEAPARHRQKGYSFHIRIDLTVPEGEIVIKREPTLYATEQVMGAQKPFSCDSRSVPRRTTPARGPRPPETGGCQDT